MMESTTLLIEWQCVDTNQSRGPFPVFGHKTERGTRQQFVAYFRQLWQEWLRHRFTWLVQKAAFNSDFRNVGGTTILIQVDYSENYEVIIQDEVQSAFYSRGHLTLLTLIIRGTGKDGDVKNFSLPVMSSDVKHDGIFVYCALDWAIDYYLTNLAPADFDRRQLSVIVWSDGGNHFKSSPALVVYTTLCRERNLSMTWNFFCPHHGKSVCDGEGF
jgi:hypothetical protein